MRKNEKINIANFVSSRGISRFGDILFDFANSTFLSSINSKSLFLIGIYQAAENLIGILFNLLGGVIADRFKRKKILLSTNIISGIGCIILSFITVEKWLIYGIVLTNIILAVLSSFSSPSYKSFTKEIVEKNNISKLNSYLEVVSTTVKVVVPLISVFLYDKLGIHGVLLLDGITFLFSGMLILFIKPELTERMDNNKISIKDIFVDLVMGFKYLLEYKVVFNLIILSALINFFLAAYNLLLPYSGLMFPKISSGLYGTILTAEATGGLLGAILSSLTNKSLNPSKMTLYLGLSGLSLLTTPILYFIFQSRIIILGPAIFSLFLAIFNIQFFSYVQQNVEVNFLGRIFGIIYTVAVLFMPIGTIIFTIALKPTFQFNFTIIGASILLLSGVFYNLFKKYSIRK